MEEQRGGWVQQQSRLREKEPELCRSRIRGQLVTESLFLEVGYNNPSPVDHLYSENGDTGGLHYLSFKTDQNEYNLQYDQRNLIKMPQIIRILQLNSISGLHPLTEHI